MAWEHAAIDLTRSRQDWDVESANLGAATQKNQKHDDEDDEDDEDDDEDG